MAAGSAGSGRKAVGHLLGAIWYSNVQSCRASCASKCDSCFCAARCQPHVSILMIDFRRTIFQGSLVRKKVSCASRAGCCCGWNSASKFQKLQGRGRTEGEVSREGLVLG